MQTWTLEDRSDVIRLLALIRNDVILALTGPARNSTVQLSCRCDATTPLVNFKLISSET